MAAADAAAAKAAINANAVIDPRDFGGIGNGVADDTAALKAALASIPTGGTLHLPPGVWTYGEDLVLPRATVLRGSGMSQAAGAWADSAQLRPIDADARIFVDDFCHVENLMVNGNNVGRWAFQSGNPYDLTGGSYNAWIANKTTFINVRVVKFTEAAFVLEAVQNSYMAHCWVSETPIGYWFLHGSSIVDLVACYYVGERDGNSAARAVLSASAYDDPRTMEGRRTIANPSHVPWAGEDQGGGRDIRFWGGDFEQGSGQYQVEILDSAPYDHAWKFLGTNIDEPNALDTGTATSGSGFTITDSTKSWTANQYQGSAVTITGGTGAGQTFTIASNTATALTVDTSIGTALDGTSAYTITNALALIHLGPNVNRTTLSIRDCTLLGDGDYLHAESGHIGITSLQTVMSGNQALQSKIKLSGTAQVNYDEASRARMYCSFDSGLQERIGRQQWETYSSGSPTWDSTKKCMTVTMASSTSGAYCYMSAISPTNGQPGYVQAGQRVTIRFAISNATGPVLLRVRLSSGLRTVATFGNGAHELVYEFAGDENGFAFTSGAGSSITADVNYFYVYHDGISGAYPPSLQIWDGTLNDASGNPWLGVLRRDSAENYLQIANRASPNPPQILAAGENDANIHIDLVPKGTGTVRANNIPVLTTTGSATVSAKRIDPRVVSATSASSLSLSMATADLYAYTALAAATLTINAPTGTPLNGNMLRIRIKDDGTPRNLSWNAIYRAVGVTLPTVTVAGKVVYVMALYNEADVKWDVLDVKQEA